MNKVGLTKEEILRACDNGNAFFAQLAHQLLATMEENEKLRDDNIALVHNMNALLDESKAEWDIESLMRGINWEARCKSLDEK